MTPQAQARLLAEAVGILGFFADGCDYVSSRPFQGGTCGEENGTGRDCQRCRATAFVRMMRGFVPSDADVVARASASTETERTIALATVLGETMPNACGVIGPTVRNYLGAACVDLAVLRERVATLAQLIPGPGGRGLMHSIEESLEAIEESHRSIERVVDAMAPTEPTR